MNEDDEDERKKKETSLVSQVLLLNVPYPPSKLPQIFCFVFSGAFPSIGRYFPPLSQLRVYESSLFT